jgi:hypothetical protein
MKKLFSVIIFTICSSAVMGKIPSGYHVQKEISLNKEDTLQLLLDIRVNKKTELEEIPENAKKAVLRILKNKSEVSRKILEKPKADIELLNGKTGSKVFFFITEDWSAGFGSYNGPISVLYTIKRSKLIKATTKVELMRSLKTNWKVKELGRNGFPEIFKISCRPDFDNSKEDMKFKIAYTHYVFNGANWSRKDREVKGSWHSGEDFPPEKLFP